MTRVFAFVLQTRTAPLPNLSPKRLMMDGRKGVVRPRCTRFSRSEAARLRPPLRGEIHAKNEDVAFDHHSGSSADHDALCAGECPGQIREAGTGGDLEPGVRGFLETD